MNRVQAFGHINSERFFLDNLAEPAELAERGWENRLGAIHAPDNEMRSKRARAHFGDRQPRRNNLAIRARFPLGPIALDDPVKREFLHLSPGKRHHFTALPAQNPHREDENPQAAIAPSGIHQADAGDNRPEKAEVQQVHVDNGKIENDKVDVIGNAAAHDE